MGNESYWNGSLCQPAKAFNQSCTNALTSYICQTVTQGTVCNDTFGSGVFTCQCPYLQYFDIISNNCKNQLSFNQNCNDSMMCIDALGLSCSNGACRFFKFF